MASDVNFLKARYNSTTEFIDSTGTTITELNTKLATLNTSNTDGGVLASMYISNTTDSVVYVNLYRNEDGSNDHHFKTIKVEANAGHLDTNNAEVALSSPLSDGKFPSSRNTLNQYVLWMSKDTVFKAAMSVALGASEKVVVTLEFGEF